MISSPLIKCLTVMLSYSAFVSQPFVNYSPSDFFIRSVRATRADPTRVYALEGGGVAFNGTAYRDFNVRPLPKTGIPMFESNSNRETDIRLIFTPGFGSKNQSHSGSLLRTAHMFKEFSRGVRSKYPLVRWFSRTYPRHAIPLDVAVFDMPNAGWAPPLSDFESAMHMGQYMGNAIEELQSQRPKKNYLVCRSASCPIGLLSRQVSDSIQGIILISGTYPHPLVIAQNYEDVKRYAAGANKDGMNVEVDWEAVNGILDFLSDPRVEKGLFEGAHFLPELDVASMSGSLDEQVSPESAELWWNLLGTYVDRNTHRRPLTWHEVLGDSPHFLFQRPHESDFEWWHHDIEAYWKIFQFLRESRGMQRKRLVYPEEAA